jgi:peptidoglycan/LPS O-acetylase OafA/YrhL
MVVRVQALSTQLVSLDGVRGIAILAVMLHHSAMRLNPVSAPQYLFAWLFYQGWSGVDLFFVLSGFLITGILLDTRRADNYFLSFYARRALRIFPLYYAFLMLCFGLFSFVIPADWMPVAGDRWVYLCYATNWMALWRGPWRHSVMAHLWSLAVEEQFYFCWPLLVWLSRPAALLWSLLAAEIAIVLGRIWWVLGHGPSQAVALATITRMDGLLLGAVCAILVRRYRLPQRLVQRLPLLAGGGLAVYVLLAMTSANAERYAETIGFPLLAVCCALIVLYSVLTEGGAGPIQKFLCRRRLTQVGKYAYGLYVYHVPLFYFGDRLIVAMAPEALRNSFWFECAASAAMVVASYQFARLSYTYFERYFLNWKDRFEPRYVR